MVAALLPTKGSWKSHSHGPPCHGVVSLGLPSLPTVMLNACQAPPATWYRPVTVCEMLLWAR